MGDGLRYIDLNDAEQGPLLLAVVIPGEDPWGAFAPLRGTPWEGLIHTVSGEALSHAVHGWATPLVREIGPHPHVIMRRFLTPCALSTGGQCVGAAPTCKPGPKMPDCYEAPNLDFATAALVSRVLADMRVRRHVLAIQGAEFVLV